MGTPAEIKQRIEEFKVQLYTLCQEYKVEISTGCGCCGAGAVIEDKDGENYEFKL